MALIQCKECGKMVSDTTDKCIHCGCEIEKKEVKETEVKKVDNNKSKNKIIGFVFAVLASICGIIQLVKMSYGGLVLIYSLMFISSAVLLAIYSYPRNKKNSNLLFVSLVALLIGSIVRIIQEGMGLEYLIRYTLIAISSVFLMYSTYKDKKPNNVIPFVLLALVAADAVYDFFALNNTLIKGYYWRLYLVIEALLSIAFILINYSKENLNKNIKNVVDKFPNKFIIVGSIVALAVIFFLLSLDTGNTVNVIDNNKNNTTIKDNDDNDNSGSTGQTTQEEVIEVEIGKTIEDSENYSMQLISSSFSNKVKPSKPKGYYSYYEIKDKKANTYFVLKTKIKNLGAETLDGDSISKAILVYDEKYRYDTFGIFEEDDGSDIESYSWSLDIEPLKTKKIWFIVEVPLEVSINKEKTLKAEFEINGKIYHVKIR